MARSSYIYVVLRGYTNKLTATFTVKHELKTWIGRQPASERRHYHCYRCRDGLHGNKEPMEVSWDA